MEPEASYRKRYAFLRKVGLELYVRGLKGSPINVNAMTKISNMMSGSFARELTDNGTGFSNMKTYRAPTEDVDIVIHRWVIGNQHDVFFTALAQSLTFTDPNLGWEIPEYPQSHIRFTLDLYYPGVSEATLDRLIYKGYKVNQAVFERGVERFKILLKRGLICLYWEPENNYHIYMEGDPREKDGGTWVLMARHLPLGMPTPPVDEEADVLYEIMLLGQETAERSGPLYKAQMEFADQVSFGDDDENGDDDNKNSEAMKWLEEEEAEDLLDYNWPLDDNNAPIIPTLNSKGEVITGSDDEDGGKLEVAEQTITGPPMGSDDEEVVETIAGPPSGGLPPLGQFGSLQVGPQQEPSDAQLEQMAVEMGALEVSDDEPGIDISDVEE